MSKDSTGSSGASDATSGNDQETQSTQQIESGGSESQGRDNRVAYESYRKVLSEKKKLAEATQLLQSKLQQYEDEKMQSEGQKDQLIENLKKQLSETKDKFKKVVGTFGHKSLVEAFKTEALKAGCQNEHLDKLVKLTDLPADAIDDEFNADHERLKELVEMAKKENSIFFRESKPAPKTGTPTSRVDDKLDLSKMSIDEKARLFAETLIGSRQ
jgi:Tfp pilus assembly protein PilE